MKLLQKFFSFGLPEKFTKVIYSYASYISNFVTWMISNSESDHLAATRIETRELANKSKNKFST